MKFGVNTFIWTANFDHSNLPLLPAIKQGGFDGVEVPLFDPAQFAAADIRKGLEENGLECTICSILTGGLNMISGDAAVREKTRVHMRDAVKAAAEVGAKIIAGPLYSPVGLMTGRAAHAGRMEVGCGMLSVDRVDAFRVRRDHRHRAAEPLRNLFSEHCGGCGGAVRCD